jgi:hypothetical protein
VYRRRKSILVAVVYQPESSPRRFWHLDINPACFGQRRKEERFDEWIDASVIPICAAPSGSFYRPSSAAPLMILTCTCGCCKPFLEVVNPDLLQHSS